MATLQVRNIPETLYDALRELAEKERRSLSQQVPWMLEEAISAQQRKQKRYKLFLEELKKEGPEELPYANIDEIVQMIREDRDSR